MHPHVLVSVHSRGTPLSGQGSGRGAGGYCSSGAAGERRGAGALWGQAHYRGLCLVAGIIAKEPMSLEEEIKEIRRSGSSKALDAPEFELSDIFYFCRKGIETIMDDEVTKRFSAEELESWNLLSRTNYNFQYISLRLTVLWGLGVLIRYCFLLPLR